MYKPKDPLYSIANKFFRSEYDFVISPITLVELYSVLSRIKPFLKLREELKDANMDTIVAFILYDLHLEIVAKSFMPRLQILSRKFRVPLEYRLAIRLSEEFQLKTLDLLHIAYAYMLRKTIDYFVTGDEDILNVRDHIKQYLGLEIKEPSELL